MSEWKEVKLYDIMSFTNGKKRPYTDGAVPVYGGNGILAYSSTSNFTTCIIIGRVGAYCGNVFYEKNRCWVSDNAIAAKNKENNSIQYCYYLLKSLKLNERHIGTSQPLLTQEILNKITVKIPTFKMQQQIVKVLSTLDDKIELNTQINHNLEEQAKAIFKSWFVDFEPFQNGKFVDSELGKIPQGWRIGILSDILTHRKESLQVGEKEWSYLPIDKIPMRSLGIKGFAPNSEAQSSLLAFYKNDIIIGAMRVYFHRVIISPCSGITRTTCFVLIPKKESLLEYSLLLCNSDETIDYAQSTSKGSTMPYAVWDNALANKRILIPPDSVLNQFSKVTKNIIAHIRDSYKEQSLLIQLRDTLLPKLMSGEIDVSEVEI